MSWDDPFFEHLTTDLLTASVDSRGAATCRGFGGGFEDPNGYSIDPEAADIFARTIMKAMPSRLDRLSLLAIFARHVTDTGYHDKKTDRNEPDPKDVKAWTANLLGELRAVADQIEQDKERIANRIRPRERRLKL